MFLLLSLRFFQEQLQGPISISTLAWMSLLFAVSNASSFPHQRAMDPEQTHLLYDQCTTSTAASNRSNLFPLPIASWSFAFTCCSNYPSSDRWEGSGLSDSTFTRPILNGTAVYVSTMRVKEFVYGAFKSLPSSYRITLVSGGSDIGQPLALSAMTGWPGSELKNFIQDPRLHRWFVQVTY
jgi:hypothetical protein